MSNEYILFNEDFDSCVEDVFLKDRYLFGEGTYENKERLIFIKKDSIVNADNKFIDVRFIGTDPDLTEDNYYFYTMQFEFTNPIGGKIEKISINFNGLNGTVKDYVRNDNSFESIYGLKNFIFKLNYSEIKEKVRFFSVENMISIFSALDSHFYDTIKVSQSFCFSIKLSDLKYIASIDLKDKKTDKAIERFLSLRLYEDYYDASSTYCYIYQTVIYKDKVFIESMMYS
jgi:hypothetical protein